MIMGATSSDTGGATGGSNSKTITTANLPAHTHSIPGHTHSVPNHTHSIPAHNHGGTIANGGSHTHTITVKSGGSHSHRWYMTLNYADKTGAARDTINFTHTTRYFLSNDVAIFGIHTDGSSHKHSASSASAGSHSHTLTINNKAKFNTNNSGATTTGSGGSGNTGSQGSGTALDVTNAYIKVFIWQRTK